MNQRMFILNLGSTSTKVAVYEGEKEIAKESLHHSQDDLLKFPKIPDQKDFRKAAVRDFLDRSGFDLSTFDCVVARGGCSRPIEGGIYRITPEMLADIGSGEYGVHISNVGCFIGYELAQEYNLPVVTADTVKTDELCRLSRYTGLAQMSRSSTFHALNHKAIARKHAQEVGKPYEELNLIVAHMGGGISVAAHEKGRVVETNNALDGDGPFSPERAGALPVGSLVRMCFSGEYTKEQMEKMICGKGGLISYLGTNDGLEVEKRIENGDSYAKEVYEAMAYETCRAIGGVACVLKGKVDGILITGSLAYSDMLTDWVKDRVSFLAPIYIYPGENEMLSLAQNGVRFLTGAEEPKSYTETAERVFKGAQIPDIQDK